MKHDIVLPKTSVKKYDLLISNYAFTECVKEVQDSYIEKIIKICKRGYITGNFDPKNNLVGGYHLEELIKKIPHKIIVYEEEPSTYPGNKVLIW